MHNPWTKLRNITRPYRRRISKKRAATLAGVGLSGKRTEFIETDGSQVSELARNEIERRIKRDFSTNKLRDAEDNFFLARIIGNDLQPRHMPGQTERNLKFILRNETRFEDCKKFWIVNRIINKDAEEKIISVLDEYSQEYVVVPFELSEYSNVDWCFESFADKPLYEVLSKLEDIEVFKNVEVHAYRKKNLYAMNNNSARNIALQMGKGSSKWILPWDGNCFLTDAAWQEFSELAKQKPHFQHIIVPMARVTDLSQLASVGFRPGAFEEPQIAFRCDTDLTFNPDWPYGHRPKVELLWRLGVPGPWDQWRQEEWDLPRPTPAEQSGNFQLGSWVARLPSGVVSNEVGSKSLQRRGAARDTSIRETLDKLDLEVLSQQFDPTRLIFYSAGRKSNGPIAIPISAEQELVSGANDALQRGPYSVLDKTECAPSGNKHDYYHPAPYWWPNPDTEDGRPYVWRDGHRVPGTTLFGPESEKFDRSSIQRVFNDTTTLALAWKQTGNTAYSNHAASIVRTWFLNPLTRMNPNLRYAQVRLGRNGDEGSRTGIIETKDFYFFLDAVRMLIESGDLSIDDKSDLEGWLSEYLVWMKQSVQGKEECLANNNHGTCYDLQIGTIAAFLDDRLELLRVLRRAYERLLHQFTAEGLQPEELTRTTSAHYCCYNLQCWMVLATFGDACGHDLWNYKGADGRGLQVGLEWFLKHWPEKQWPYQQDFPFDWRRCLPLLSFYVSKYNQYPPGFDETKLTDDIENPPPYTSNDGILPYGDWGLPAELITSKMRTAE